MNTASLTLQDIIEAGIPLSDIKGKKLYEVVAEAFETSNRQAREWLAVKAIKRRYVDGNGQFIVVTKGKEAACLVKMRRLDD